MTNETEIEMDSFNSSKLLKYSHDFNSSKQKEIFYIHVKKSHQTPKKEKNEML